MSGLTSTAIPSAIVAVLVCTLPTAACTFPRTGPAPAPSAAATQSVQVACPDGRPVRAGLAHFGAYIGTWRASHEPDPQVGTVYRLAIVPGRIEVRCSADGYVISEALRPRDQAPAGLALRLALTEIPDDARKIYDHLRRGCRTLQYASDKLGQQLGAIDRDGHVDFTFESASTTYNAAAVTVIRIDVVDVLGADSRLC